MEETVVAPDTSTVAPVENVGQTPADAIATTAAPLDRREVLREEFKKAQDPTQQTNRGKHAVFQPRQPEGKFAPGQPQFPTPSRPDMPKSLKLELKQHWDTAHPDLAADIVRREQDIDKGVTEWKGRVAQADELLNEFQPYMWILKNEGATPKSAIGPLLQTAAIFRTGSPVQKAQSVVQIMRQFSIPMEHLQQVLGGTMQQHPQDPQYSQLAQTVQQIQQSLADQQQHVQQQTEARALTAIQKFAAENPHYEAVEGRMLQLLQSPQILGDTSAMSEAEKLKLAYETAIRLDPALSAQVVAPQQANAQAVRNAKAASVQVKGAPGSSVTAANTKTTDRRELIRQNLRAMQ